MITDSAHAAAVQTRRRLAGKKGRSKAVRRWAKREFGAAIDTYTYFMPDALIEALAGDFKGCNRGWQGMDVELRAADLRKLREEYNRRGTRDE